MIAAMRSSLALALAAALVLPATAAAAPPAPFGHPCAPQSGVLFCPTDTLGDRVATWDGVPLDVDVTLPPTGDGPFPTLFLEHGYPGTKETFEATAPEGDGGSTYHYNNVFYAQRGYAVVNLSARGFGRSCGTTESRTAGCERGWTHIADQRYEVRDIQHLMGRLVDEGIADPARLSVSGVSGGGGRAIALAFLKDRIRLPDGSFAPWTSPAGTPLSLARAFPRWAWYDLPNALVPNGRPRAGRVGNLVTGLNPIGVPKRTWIDLLYAGGALAGFLSPPGADPQADLATWRSALDEPAYGERQRDIATTLASYIGGGAGIPGSPAPMLLENGWTDELFPADEALRAAKRARKEGAAAGVLLADLGHGWATNPASVDHALNDAGAAFLDGGAPPGVVAVQSTCSGGAPAPVTGASLAGLQDGTLRLRRRGAHTVTSDGGDPAVGKAIDGTSGSWCHRVEVSGRNAIVAQRRSRGDVLIGSLQIKARVHATGGPAQIAARLWDVDDGEGRLIARGLWRPRMGTGQSPVPIRMRLQLHPNFYKFPSGHRIRVELLGADAPYAQAPERDFRVRVSRLRVRMPVR
jgi:hypothetical protein